MKVAASFLLDILLIDFFLISNGILGDMSFQSAHCAN